MRFLFLLLPEGEDFQRLFPQDLLHGQAAVFVSALQFIVDEGIIETHLSRVGSQRGIEDSGRAGPVNGAQAHGAGLAGSVKFASGQLECLQSAAGFTNSHDLRVRRGIIGGSDTIRTFRHYAAFLHHQRSKGASTAGTYIFDGERNRAAHEFYRHRPILFQGALSPLK